MHELGITQEIIALVSEHSGGRKVTRIVVLRPGCTSDETFCSFWIANVCGNWPLFTIVKTIVPLCAVFVDSRNLYSVIFTVTR